MKVTRVIAAAALVAASGLTMNLAQAQVPGIQRTDLVQNDLSAPGQQVVQTRVDFEPGVASLKHSHPGEEVAHVLEGTLEYRLEGRAPVTLKAGEALFIPAGVAHVATNVGSGKASELATYVVRKGAPLSVQVK
jgi:quercetin dioxygenase-like cupin family protein